MSVATMLGNAAIPKVREVIANILSSVMFVVNDNYVLILLLPIRCVCPDVQGSYFASRYREDRAEARDRRRIPVEWD